LYNSTKNLNKKIDTLLRHSKFTCQEIEVDGELYELYSRDIVECIQALWGDPDFVLYLVFKPERHYADEDKTIRMVHDMHTGKWWWDTQVSCLLDVLSLLSSIPRKMSRRKPRRKE